MGHPAGANLRPLTAAGRGLPLAGCLQNCHRPAVSGVGPCPGLWETHLDKAHFVKETLGLSLPRGLRVPWPVTAPLLALGAWSSPSDHTLSPRDFPGKAPSLEAAGLSWPCWLIPSEARAAGSVHAAREPKISRLVSGLHWEPC